MTINKSGMSLAKFGSRVALVAGFSCLSSLVYAQSQPLEARVIVQYTQSSTGVATAQAGPTVNAKAANETRMRNLSLRSGLVLRSGRHVSPDMHVVTAQGITSAQLAQQLSRQPGVAFAVEDRRVKAAAIPNDPYYATVLDGETTKGPVSGQWYLKPPNSIYNSSINAERAWDFSTGSASVVVAVLDTGIRADHPDFAANILGGYDFVSNDIIAGDPNSGRDSDASDPGDWTTESESGIFGGCSVGNSSWHGTQTAGLIGANTNNNRGMASVGRTVRILPVRVLGKCGGTDSDVIAGMRWAAGLTVPGVPANANPAKVLNMSLGGSGACTDAYISAMTEIATTGAVVVAAAGNEGGHAVSAPANCSGVIAVSAINHSGTKTSYADIGPEIAISAPGGNCNRASEESACLFPILSTTNLGTTTPSTYDDVAGVYYTDSHSQLGLGTSFSTPLVAGTVALMLSIDPTLTATNIKTILQNTARPFPSMGSGSSVAQCRAPNPATSSQFDQGECYCTTSTCGAGMLDAGAAVQFVDTRGQPKITASSATPQAQESLTLSANSSVVPAGRTITAYAWTLIDGGGIVSRIESGADTATATVTPISSGRFAVRLVMTDNTTQQYSITQSVEVADAPPPPPSASLGAQRSTGGGSLQPFALLGLLAAVMLLWAHRRRNRSGR